MGTAIKYYVCAGNVRGECHYRHRTYAAAEKHLDQDRRACKAQGGYGDRIIEGRDVFGDPVELDENGNESIFSDRYPDQAAIDNDSNEATA